MQSESELHVAMPVMQAPLMHVSSAAQSSADMQGGTQHPFSHSSDVQSVLEVQAVNPAAQLVPVTTQCLSTQLEPEAQSPL